MTVNGINVDINDNTNFYDIAGTWVLWRIDDAILGNWVKIFGKK